MSLDNTDWEDPLLADLRALGEHPPTGLSVYESIDPVEAGAPDLPPEILMAPTDEPEVDPARDDEFVCASCFLLRHRSQRCLDSASAPLCADCS